MELAKHENFAGVKECEGNERIKGYTDKGIVCAGPGTTTRRTTRASRLAPSASSRSPPTWSRPHGGHDLLRRSQP